MVKKHKLAYTITKPLRYLAYIDKTGSLEKNKNLSLKQYYITYNL